jgi:uncharacterized membrane protein YtjA (UPF0391 family)
MRLMLALLAVAFVAALFGFTTAGEWAVPVARGVFFVATAGFVVAMVVGGPREDWR